MFQSLYIVSSRMGLSTWIADLAARGNAMDKYADVLNKSSSVTEAVSKVTYILVAHRLVIEAVYIHVVTLS